MPASVGWSTSRLSAVSAILLPVLLLIVYRQSDAHTLAEHPYIEANEIRSDTCLKCHPDKQGGKFTHAAVDSGCEICHLATSAKGKTSITLIATGGELCATCHDATDAGSQKAHHGQPFATSRCTECHDPHGSDRPKLINNFVHQPFADNQCDSCHRAPREGKVDVNEGGKRALCYTCHEDMQKQVESSKSQHPVFQTTDTCTVCHSPHASRVPRLLRSSQGQVCASCHEKSTEPVRHGPYDQGQCAACHNPHGAEEPRLLRAKVNNLCRACHVLGQSGVEVGEKTVTLPWRHSLSAVDYQAAPKVGLDRDNDHGHPLVGHPTSGRNTKLPGDGAPITCLSCHQAHSSKVYNLMPDKVADDIQLCEVCHK